MQVKAHLLGCLLLVAAVLSVGATDLAAAESERSSEEGGDVYAGECSGCHGSEGEGALEGPSLQVLLDSEEAVAGVAEIVRSGYGDMDPFEDELSDSQIQAVASYVVSRFGRTGDVPDGGVLYRLNCAGCHGAASRGGALIYSEENASSLMETPTPVVASAIRSGPETMPAYNQAALSDAQVASISAYVRALQTPPQPGGVEMTYHGPVSEGFIGIVGGLGAAILAALWMERGGRG